MTPNKEDYLKCIYELSQLDQKMTNKRIAEEMDVSAPAVSEMIKKMIAEQLIQKDKTTGYTLMENGQRLVAKLYRKHRLIEVLLLNHLGYSTDEVHAEAEVLEHVVSDLFIDRLDKMLGFPSECPHGGTIPKPNQLLVEKNHLTLSQVTAPGLYTLVRVRDNIQLLQYIEQHNLAIGSNLELLEHDSYAGTFSVKADQKIFQITDVIAEQIYVERKN